MRKKGFATLAGCVLGVACAAFLNVQWIPGSPATGQEAATKTEKSAEPVPAYHSRAPRKPLPSTLPWEQFAGNAYAENGYFLASRIREVLYQQPCYCHCDRSLGHSSLLDCYTRPDKHAAICQTCLMETFFADEEARAGKTAAEIRKEIIRGDWKRVNLAKYSSPPRP
jgi:uncharacterized protein with PCYCGC motif